MRASVERTSSLLSFWWGWDGSDVTGAGGRRRAALDALRGSRRRSRTTAVRAYRRAAPPCDGPARCEPADELVALARAGGERGLARCEQRPRVAVHGDAARDLAARPGGLLRPRGRGVRRRVPAPAMGTTPMASSANVVHEKPGWSASIVARSASSTVITCAFGAPSGRLDLARVVARGREQRSRPRARARRPRRRRGGAARARPSRTASGRRGRERRGAGRRGRASR